MQELDILIEEKVFGRPCPEDSTDESMIGWEKQGDGTYVLYSYNPDARSFYASDSWPRNFSDNIMLAWCLVIKYAISVLPVTTLEGVIVEWEAELSLDSEVRIVGSTASEAICLLVAEVVKNE